MRAHSFGIRGLLLTAVVLVPRGADAFTACNQNDSFPICDPTNGKPCHWPDSRNTSNFGTQKWDFDWVMNNEGIEIRNVMYTSDLSQPKKLVMARGSIPMLSAHYYAGPNCPNGVAGTGPAYGYPDPVSALDPGHFCCAHVPTTPCYQDDRSGVCVPRTETSIQSCPGGTTACNGVCLGTQDPGSPIEDGIGETVSGLPTADVVIGGTFVAGTYQFVQRWRFRDDGTIIPSMRLGSIWDCQLHSHQVYWRLDFDLTGTGQSEVVQQCDDGTCPDTGTTNWSSNLSCQCGTRPTATTSWRISDSNVSGRAVVVHSGVNEGQAPTFCQNATDCTSGCFATHDFCALPSPVDSMNFMRDYCDDRLDPAGPEASTWTAACTGFSGGTNSSFWYFGHVDLHDPCTYEPICDPKPAATTSGVAFGPTINLVGSW
jgi:hypothetical protein